MSATASMHERFHPRRSDVRATELARGPWDPDAQHGGAPAALLMRAFESLERQPGSRSPASPTSSLRPVPLGQLARRGRASFAPAGGCSCIEASLRTPGRDRGGPRPRAAGHARGRRCRAQQPSSPRLRAPRTASTNDYVSDRGGPTVRRATRWRSASWRARSTESGPATAWFRLRKSARRGRAVLRRCSGWPLRATSATGSPRHSRGIEYMFINPDLTLYIDAPRRSATGSAWSPRRSSPPGGIGIAESVLYDRTRSRRPRRAVAATSPDR